MNLSMSLSATRRSISSSSSSTGTTPSEWCSIQVQENKPYYSFSINKPVPLLPPSNSDPYLIEYPGSYRLPFIFQLSVTHPCPYYSVPFPISNLPYNDCIPACLCSRRRQYTPYNRDRYYTLCRSTYSTWTSHRTFGLATCGSFAVLNERKTRMVER